MNPPLRAAPGPGLEDFAARTLDWSGVQALVLPFARSELGRRTLLEMAPLSDRDVQSALGRLCEWNSAGEAEGEPPLAGLCDAPRLLAGAAAEGRALSCEQLLALAGFLRSNQAARGWLAERRTGWPWHQRLGDDLVDLSGPLAMLEGGLDSRGEVREDASAELARVRADLRRTGRDMEQKLKDLSRRPAARSALADGHVGHVHQRHGRMVLAIRATHLGQVPGAVLDRSASGETLYVEPREFADLGNRLVELAADEAREVSRLLVEWTRSLLARRGDVERAAGALARLELALVGRDFARAFGGVVALLPGQPGAADGLLLRAARHPLLAAQERSGRIPRCVPMDLRLGGAFDQLLITGPNTGGKTLVLKTAGLAVLMTRLGLPILAEAGSTVPLYRSVVADIGDEQEVEQSLSTFASHVKRLAAGLARAAPDVLMLLDEVGGATDPEEGAALGEVLLMHLLERRVPTLATTHLERLVEYAWRNGRVENASVEFDPETLAPTYRLTVGAPGKSQALHVAERLGLPRQLIDAARKRLVRRPDEVVELVRALGSSRLAAESARAEADRLLAELAQREARLEREEADLAARRAALLGDLDGEMEQRLAGAQGPLAALTAALPQLPAAQRVAFDVALKGLRESLAQAAWSTSREAFFARLGKGSPVFLARYGRRCPVQRLDRARRILWVRLGQRDVEVHFDDVSAFEAL